MSKRVYFIILNWNAWKDTVECLESLMRQTYPDYRIVVCDNGSADESIERVVAWSKGTLLASGDNHELKRLITPPVEKPIDYVLVKPGDLYDSERHARQKLIIIENGENMGFAAGHNTGLRYALSDPEFKYAWVLNNDTVIEPDALSKLVGFLKKNQDVGICGSLLLRYSDPDQVQIVGGGSYRRWLGRIVLQPKRRRSDVETANISHINYISGASMFVTRDFLENIGLMEERYFLYHEEMDWSFRAAGRYKLGVARDSIVYHKLGASSGTSRQIVNRSLISEQYATYSRVLFTKKLTPLALPIVLVLIMAGILYRFATGSRRHAIVMLSAAWAGLRTSISV